MGNVKPWESVHFKRHDHLKNGDIDFEGLLVVEIFHGIGAIHLAHFRAEIKATHVLIPFARLQNGLDTHHPLALDLAIGPIAVEDMPVAAMQLD